MSTQIERTYGRLLFEQEQQSAASDRLVTLKEGSKAWIRCKTAIDRREALIKDIRARLVLPHKPEQVLPIVRHMPARTNEQILQEMKNVSETTQASLQEWNTTASKLLQTVEEAILTNKHSAGNGNMMQHSKPAVHASAK